MEKKTLNTERGINCIKCSTCYNNIKNNKTTTKPYSQFHLIMIAYLFVV